MPTPSQSPTLTAAQFNALDINKDGKVDYSEANRLYQGQGLTQAQLLAMDSNKDGVITLKEQQAWMAQQAAAGAPMPQYRTEYVPQQKTVQRTVMAKQQVPKMVQKQRVVPKFEWDRRMISVPRQIEVPKVNMVRKTVTVLVPETTNVTKVVNEYKNISIPRQGETTEMYWDQEMEEVEVPRTYNETVTEMVAVVREAVPVPVKKKVKQRVPVQRMRKSMQAVEVGTTSQLVGQQVVGTEILDQSKLASGAYGNYVTSPQSAVASGSFVSASPGAVASSSFVSASPTGVVIGSSTNLFATNDGTQAMGGASVAGIKYNADGSMDYK